MQQGFLLRRLQHARRGAEDGVVDVVLELGEIVDEHADELLRLAVVGSLVGPGGAWVDKAAYDRQAKKLVGMFIDNFAKFEEHVDNAVLGAAPRALEAAE